MNKCKTCKWFKPWGVVEGGGDGECMFWPLPDIHDIYTEPARKKSDAENRCVVHEPKDLTTP